MVWYVLGFLITAAVMLLSSCQFAGNDKPCCHRQRAVRAPEGSAAGFGAAWFL